MERARRGFLCWLVRLLRPTAARGQDSTVPSVASQAVTYTIPWALLR